LTSCLSQLNYATEAEGRRFFFGWQTI